jgi:hypothetical protein
LLGKWKVGAVPDATAVEAMRERVRQFADAVKMYA